MTEKDRPAFARLMAQLATAFTVEVSRPKAEIYFEALSNLPIAALERATAEVIRTSRFFPKPAELRAAAYDTWREERVPRERRLEFKPKAPAPGEARRVLRQLLGGTAFGRRLGLDDEVKSA